MSRFKVWRSQRGRRFVQFGFRNDQAGVFARIVKSSGEPEPKGSLLAVGSDGELICCVDVDRDAAKAAGIKLNEEGRWSVWDEPSGSKAREIAQHLRDIAQTSGFRHAWPDLASGILVAASALEECSGIEE